MPGNNDPIFSKQGDLTNNASTGMGQPITAAANDFTGAGANNVVAFTADATNGSFISRLRLKANGTNVASVLRIFINNGATAATATNNSLYGEIALPATTANAAALTAPDFDYAMNLALPPGFRVVVGLGTAVAGGWTVTPVAGKY
jgi:hypothetical protein